MRNATTLEPHCTRFDVGAVDNLEQVFGKSRLLWWLPVGGEPTVDGISWPTNTRESSLH